MCALAQWREIALGAQKASGRWTPQEEGALVQAVNTFLAEREAGTPVLGCCLGHNRICSLGRWCRPSTPSWPSARQGPLCFWAAALCFACFGTLGCQPQQPAPL